MAKNNAKKGSASTDAGAGELEGSVNKPEQRSQVSDKSPAKKAQAKEQAKKAQAKKDASKDAQKKAASKKAAQKKPNAFKRLAVYLHSVRTEMKRVTWPTRQEVMRSSLIVIVALVFFGLLIFAIDSAVVPLLTLYSGLAA